MQIATRYKTLDGLRGVAALCVMAGHIGQQLDVYWPSNLFLAVDVFFIMSGFVLAHSYGERLRNGMSAWDYLGRRIIRLYPMFIAGLLIGVAVLCLGVRSIAPGIRAGDILHSALLNAVYLPYLSSVSTGSSVGMLFPANPPAWSLYLEVLASGGFLFLLGLRRRALLTICAVSLVLTACGGFYFARVQGMSGIWLNTGYLTSNMLGGLPRAAFGFTLGVLLYGLVRDGYGRRLGAVMAKMPYASFALYAVLVAVLLCPKSGLGVYPFVVLMAAAPAIVFVSAHIRPCNGLEIWAAWFLGWISYPVYCLHVPVLRLMMLHSLAGHGTFEIAAVASTTTLVLAMVLAKWYDEPIRAALSRWLLAHRPVSLRADAD